MRNNIKFYFTIFHDLTAVIICFYLALAYRLGVNSEIFTSFNIEFIIYFICNLISFAYFGLHKAIWKYTSLDELISIIKTITVAIISFTVILFVITRMGNYPRSSLIVNWFLLISYICFSRLVSRIYHEKILGRKHRAQETIHAIIIGNSKYVKNYLRNIQNDANNKYKILAIIDDKNHGRKIHDVPIFQGINDLKKTINKISQNFHPVEKIILSGVGLDKDITSKIVKDARDLAISLFKLPDNSFNEKDNLVPVKIEDLLRRNQHKVNHQEISSLFTNKRILITGAGGTIGAELTRQVRKYNPAKLCLIDNSEFALYKIDHECNASSSNPNVIAKIIDVRDAERVANIFAEFKPHIVLHAAALKHVPLLEDHLDEAILTNVIGTKNVTDHAYKNNAELCLMISTDKAINPTSKMGASKRLAELYCQSFSTLKPKSNNTKFVVVRFGNVLGSNGSVVPLFEKQIRAGGPITLTHADITRYFMTIPEAVGLVLEASSMSYKENKSNVYVLDMGEPIKIKDLAEQMIMLSGLVPEKDIKIEVIGLRPGEKLYEELFYEHENLSKTTNSGIFLANPRVVEKVTLDKELKKLQNFALKGDKEKSLNLLKKLVKSYKEKA